MDEFISREATIKRIKEVYCVGCNSYNGVRCRACGTGDAIDMIEDAPAAERRMTNMVENVCVTVSNYATEALQDTLNFYGKEGFSLVSTQMASNKYGCQVMYLFFVRQTGEKWQPPKGE